MSLTTRLCFSALMLGLSGMAVGCLATTTSYTISPAKVIPPKNESESFQEFGERVCAEEGEETRFSGKYQITCEEHGGIRIVDTEAIETMGKFHYPESRRLSLEELVVYVADKIVALFGEGHNPEDSLDAEQFITYLPRLKQVGFTHVGMEMSYRLQGVVDDYVSNPTTENRNTLLKVMPYYDFTKKEFLQVIDAAIQHHLPVVCLDNLDKGRTIARDQYMKKKIDEIVGGGGRIAAFLGAAHVSTKKEELTGYAGNDFGGGVYGLLTINPVGRELVREYGSEKVGLIDLTGCSNSYIPVCMEALL